MEQDVPGDLGGVLPVYIPEEVVPAVLFAQAVNAAGGRGRAGGADHGLIGDGIVALIIQRIDGDGVGLNIHRYVVGAVCRRVGGFRRGYWHRCGCGR